MLEQPSRQRMNSTPPRHHSVAELVARFDNDKPASPAPPSQAAASPLGRLPSGRVRQLAGAYEAQLRALLKHLEDERDRRQQRRARRQRSFDEASALAEDAVLEAALQDVQRLLAAHCHATPHTTSHTNDASEGPGTPDPLDQPAPLVEVTVRASTGVAHDDCNAGDQQVAEQGDASLQATEQRVHDLLQRMHGGSGWWTGARALEPQPTCFDPLTANSMYADPLRLARHCSDEDD